MTNVVVQVAEGLRAETAARSGLLQVDSVELPPSLSRGKWDFAYRYAAVPFELKLSVEKVEPRVTVDSLTEIDLSPDRLTATLSAVYDVQRAGVFRFEWDVPEGYEIREVQVREVRNANKMTLVRKRLDTGEVLVNRKLAEHEVMKQGELFETEA